MFVSQLCLTLWEPTNCSSVHGIFWARIMEWVAFPSPGNLPDPWIKSKFPILQADSLPLSHQGSPYSLGKEMATHSKILAWKTPWTEEPGRLDSATKQQQHIFYLPPKAHELYLDNGCNTLSPTHLNLQSIIFFKELIFHKYKNVTFL